MLDIADGDLRTVLTLEEDEDARPRREVVRWTADGRYVYFTYSAHDHWERGLKRLDLGSGEMEALMLDANLYRGWRISGDGATVVYTMSDGDRPDDVWVTGSDFAVPTRLTELNSRCSPAPTCR